MRKDVKFTSTSKEYVVCSSRSTVWRPPLQYIVSPLTALAASTFPSRNDGFIDRSAPVNPFGFPPFVLLPSTVFLPFGDSIGRGCFPRRRLANARARNRAVSKINTGRQQHTQNISLIMDANAAAGDWKWDIGDWNLLQRRPIMAEEPINSRSIRTQVLP